MKQINPSRTYNHISTHQNLTHEIEATTLAFHNAFQIFFSKIEKDCRQKEAMKESILFKNTRSMRANLRTFLNLLYPWRGIEHFIKVCPTKFWEKKIQDSFLDIPIRTRVQKNSYFFSGSETKRRENIDTYHDSMIYTNPLEVELDKTKKKSTKYEEAKSKNEEEKEKEEENKDEDLDLICRLRDRHISCFNNGEIINFLNPIQEDNNIPKFTINKEPVELKVNKGDQFSKPIRLIKLFPVFKSNNILQISAIILGDDHPFIGELQRDIQNFMTNSNAFNNSKYMNDIGKIYTEIISPFQQYFQLYYYRECDSDILPQKREKPYSKFDHYLHPNTTYEKVYENLESNTFVFFCLYEGEIKYVVKTSVIKHFLKNDKISSNNYENQSNPTQIRKLVKFFKLRFEEYKILDSLKYLGNIQENLQIEIVYLSKLGYVAFESISPYAGEPLNEIGYFKTRDAKFALFITDWVLNVLAKLERHGIAHCDLKPEHIRVKILPTGEIILKLIDFDIFHFASSESFSNDPESNFDFDQIDKYTINYNSLKGFTPKYESPEILYNSINEIFPPANNRINPWKCQIYTVGLIALIMSGFFEKCQIEFSSLKEYKSSHIKHLSFLYMIRSYRKISKDEDLSKLLIFAENALTYNSQNRFVASALIKELKKIKKTLINVSETDLEKIMLLLYKESK